MAKQILLLDNVHKSIKNKEIVKALPFQLMKVKFWVFLDQMVLESRPL